MSGDAGGLGCGRDGDFACGGGGGDGQAVLVLDSGGGYVRAGLASDASPRVTEPNCSATRLGPGRGPSPRSSAVVIGADVFELPAYALHRPNQRGLLLDLEQQRAVWDSILGRDCFSSVDTSDCSVLVTEAPFTPASVRRDVVEILFEDFGFRSVGVAPAPLLAAQSPGLAAQLSLGAGRGAPPCCYTLLDAGFSGCVAIPCLEGRPIRRASRRLGVGGRVLTNLLAERLRLRHYDLSQNWLLAEDVLAKVCEVSLDFDRQLRCGFADVAPYSYLLPDFHTTCRGSVEKLGNTADLPPVTPGDCRQRLVLQAERVAVPEALFRPQDHGLYFGGVAELVQQAICGVSDELLRPHLGQVVVCGGLARLPHFCDRLSRELRQIMPSDWPVTVLSEPDPELSAWRGAAHLAVHSEAFRRARLHSRQRWAEEGWRPFAQERVDDVAPATSNPRVGKRKSRRGRPS